MISIVITSKNEAGSIGRAIGAFAGEDYKGEGFEIIVVAPDEATLNAAQAAYAKTKLLRDAGHSKAEALNLTKRHIKGEWVIFSDGDVRIEKGAVAELLKKRVGAAAVGGRPVYWQQECDRQPYKFWQESLLTTAHELRQRAAQNKEMLLLSGYLFMLKTAIFRKVNLPADLLAEDEYISNYLWQQGYVSVYAPEAKVMVKYPNNYNDWLKQKVRTLAAGYQLKRSAKRRAMRSFRREVGGVFLIWRLNVKNFKQAIWMGALLAARLHAWLLAFYKFKILKQKQKKIWQRVESTK